MPEYIEREKFKNILKAKAEMAIGTPKEVFYNAVKMLELIPTADVVEVVRCGQCQHWKINPHNLYGGYCRYSECASIDHYCSYGKRKEVKDA